MLIDLNFSMISNYIRIKFPPIGIIRSINGKIAVTHNFLINGKISFSLSYNNGLKIKEKLQLKAEDHLSMLMIQEKSTCSPYCHSGGSRNPGLLILTGISGSRLSPG